MRLPDEIEYNRIGRWVSLFCIENIIVFTCRYLRIVSCIGLIHSSRYHLCHTWHVVPKPCELYAGSALQSESYTRNWWSKNECYYYLCLFILRQKLKINYNDSYYTYLTAKKCQKKLKTFLTDQINSRS